ncbi:hypothetical protein COCSADRAFT_33930 [Bipolaris sorokiniana ND90Pr]|uniref:Zn(2)-C6 fungal-type domain-containing protein n=1 Tax=Cochliobolus sativus (strain ND90Pr / ATCC 201652) TaxID=665912 RepID=M2TE72_COCSN|nr:uncharacterized protein COCSADRAFT_33930 [Bipolaris sorokiniana ND90Pr]EMD67042.1 hypothetical protein COCSADRAFT_33930 [Bipolaris sorokiniana ND90Pr]
MSFNTGPKGRQRVTTACLGCRDKRTKCNGHPVQCSACQYRNQECVYYFTENKRKPPSKTYVQALEARVKALEKQLALSKPDAEFSISAVQNEPSTSSERFPQAQLVDPVDEVTDTLGGFCVADGGEIRYFGSRSNFNLIQTTILSKKSSKDMQREGYNAASIQLQPFEISQDLHEHLLQLYWTWQNPWQYFISPTLLTSSLLGEPISLFGPFHSPLLLAAVYALASRYSDRPEIRTDPQDPNTAGETFLIQVRIMLQYESEAPTTRTVQAVLLLSLIETARDKEALGFTYCGMATRMALNLGLHIDSSPCVSKGLLTAEELEDRQVTWGGVYMLDKLFNIGLGRPSMIQERDVTAKPPALDSKDELLRWYGTNRATQQPIVVPCHYVSIAQHTRELFSAAAEALDVIYSPNYTTRSNYCDELVSKTHLRLVSFHCSLPSHLRLPRTLKADEKTVTPHVLQFHLQYHVIFILLHRPFLKIVRRPGTTVAEGNQDASSHLAFCRDSATWISKLLAWQTIIYGMRCTPISTVHCAFTAAVIFLTDAATVTGKVQESALRNLKVCVEALEEMEMVWSWSTRSLLALCNIAEGWNVETTVFDNLRYRKLSPGPGSGQSGEASDFEAFLADTDPTGLYQDGLFDWNANDFIATSAVVPVDLNDSDFSVNGLPPFQNLY